VAVAGSVPRGLPRLGPPALGWHNAAALLGAAASMFVVILAQSAATSRAYAVKYEEPFSEDTDLVGLAAADRRHVSGPSIGHKPPLSRRVPGTRRPTRGPAPGPTESGKVLVAL
jgi:hypothetical protein